ncbi:MAG TPA: ATP synthase F1 subunit gamma [Spirochaetia bacterium]|nr:ATP synthase F1 subunit gamma [Spirochaetia bacterium]
MAKTRQIRKRIVSVRNINKITKTMEKVAQSKIMKLNARFADAKTFRGNLLRLLPEALGAARGTSDAQEALAAQPLTAPRPRGKRVMLFVVTSSRGLCGGYNAKVLAATRARMQELSREGREASLAVLGRKGLSFFRYHNQPVEIALGEIDENVPFLKLQSALDQVVERYLAKTVDEVDLVSTRYLTKIAQEVRIVRLLPFEFPTAGRSAPARTRTGEPLYYVEPSRKDVLSSLVPMAVAAELFCSVLEAMLGEQAQRSFAMRSASDNADSMTKRLTRSYNRARQTQITSEMIEIISGSEGGRE